MKLITAVIFTLLVLTACRTAGGEETQTIQAPYPTEVGTVNINLTTTAGDIIVTPGDFAGVSGTATTNVGAWIPNVTISGSAINIAQGRASAAVIPDAQNRWDLALGGGVPITLSHDNEDANGQFNLSGLMLNALSVDARGGDYIVRYASPLTSDGSTTNITTQNGSVEITGFLNSKPLGGTITTFGGDVTLGLDGTAALEQSADLRVETRVGNVQLNIPQGLPVRVNYRTSSGTILEIDPQFTRVDSVTITNGDVSGDVPFLNIDIRTTSGDLRLAGAR